MVSADIRDFKRQSKTNQIKALLFLPASVCSVIAMTTSLSLWNPYEGLICLLYVCPSLPFPTVWGDLQAVYWKGRAVYSLTCAAHDKDLRLFGKVNYYEKVSKTVQEKLSVMKKRKQFKICVRCTEDLDLYALFNILFWFFHNCSSSQTNWAKRQTGGVMEKKRIKERGKGEKEEKWKVRRRIKI